MRSIIALLAVTCAAYATTRFGCNLEIDDKTRQLFLDFHNEKRAQLVKGGVAGFSQAGNMYKLSWSCDLERKAQEHIKNCPASAGNFGSYGFNNRMYTATGSGAAGAFANPKPQIEDTLKAWWEPVKRQQLDKGNKYPSNSQLYHVANIIHAATTQVGCTYHVCSGPTQSKMEIFCLYDDVANTVGQPVYDTGKPCENGRDCTTYRKSKCDKKTGLCVKPAEKPDDGKSNMCDKGNGLTDKTRRTIVDLHNYFRSLVARGKAEDKLSTNGFAPRAKSMLKLEYDCGLEKTAADYARRCFYRHSQPDERKKAGENLYAVSMNNADKTKAGEWATRNWFRELKDFGVGSSNLLTEQLWNRRSTDPRVHIQIGHYTQMVWGTTTKIGCGIQHCNGNNGDGRKQTLVVCHYAEGGNVFVVGGPPKEIYAVGATCSSCPSGYRCDEDKLCART